MPRTRSALFWKGSAIPFMRGSSRYKSWPTWLEAQFGSPGENCVPTSRRNAAGAVPKKPLSGSSGSLCNWSGIRPAKPIYRRARKRLTKIGGPSAHERFRWRSRRFGGEFSHDQTRTLGRGGIFWVLPFVVRATDAERRNSVVRWVHIESSFSDARRSGAFLVHDCIQLANAAGFPSLFHSGGATERRFFVYLGSQRFTRQRRADANPGSCLCQWRGGLSLRKIQRQIRSRGF